jgi:hypothetical protein
MSLLSRRAARRTPLALGAAGALLVALVGAAPASAGAPVPWWQMDSVAEPTHLPQGGEGRIVVTATNRGDEAVNGSSHPVTITDVLPAGLTATHIEGKLSNGGTAEMTCEEPSLRCTWAHVIASYQTLIVIITVKVETNAPASNEAKIEEGGTLRAKVSRPVKVSGEAVPFGVEKYELAPEDEGGSPDTQAGSHPFQLTTTLDFNRTLQPQPGKEEELTPNTPAPVKDLRLKLPPGLIGNVRAIPQCSALDFNDVIGGRWINFCPADTAVGVASVIFKPEAAVEEWPVPVFNLVPAAGEPARFGFDIFGALITLDTSVLSGRSYAAVVSVSNASQAVVVLGSQVTLWGVPGSAVHDQARGWACVGGGFVASQVREGSRSCSSPQQPPPAFLTLPTSCTEPLKSTVEARSWVPGAEFLKAVESPSAGFLEGCSELPFSPSIEVEPETHEASAPTGLKVHVHLPQETTLAAEGKGEADVKDTTITFPPGMQLSPSAANGLEACSELEVGFEGFEKLEDFEPEAPPATFTPSLPEPLSPGVNFCPNASRVGNVLIKTPLLKDPLEGGVYLAKQNANPFGSLIAMYIVAEDHAAGVLVKLAGEVKLNEQTGQVTSTFASTPEQPFEDLEVELFGGPHASFTTPPLCGSYATTTSFTAWSGKTEAPSSARPLEITSGPNGTSCPSAQPFAPSFQAGTTSNQAAGFTPFTLTISRPDGDQALRSISMQLPPGLAANLASVTPCPEPQASLGTCGPESLIGHSTSSSGLGAEPFTLPGSVYLTGPYKGAPFGLSAVTPAKAGPFNLGNVVVRSTINVDRNTAAASINTESATIINTEGSSELVNGIPELVKGVPSQIKQLNVTIERPGFELNPTNCNPMAITGTLTSWQGASEAVSSPFRAANCASLPFKPKLTAAAGGRGSKANGTSFFVKLESAGLGQANIGKVDLRLPLALPSRLTTIQKACTAAAFEANPASCPEGSNVGMATIHTPILKNPLSGPAYLVSHGSAAFPDVEFVLQGEGITLVLDGKTDIKKGITYSRFETNPDAPFTTFETTLPAGPHSALTANVPEKAHYSLCGTPLVMPTVITGQNGAIITQNTKIAVTGCPKGLTAAQKLAQAMKACKKLKKKNARVACEARARKAYKASLAAARHKKRK